MDNKTKKDIDWILSTLGYQESEKNHYLKKVAEPIGVDLETASKEGLQAILQGIILDYGKKRHGFSTEIGEELTYILIAIKDIVPEFDYRNVSEKFFLDDKLVDYNPIDVENDFEVEISFSFKEEQFRHKYYGIEYIDEFIQDINREILIPKFNVRFYQLLNLNEIIAFVLFPSSIEPEEFLKYADYL